MSEITIRAARRQDIEDLYEVFSEADQLHRRAHPEIFQKAKSDHQIKDYYRSCIADPNYVIFVAETPNDIIAAILCSSNTTSRNPVLVPRKYALIENLAVRTNFRKIGVGKALMSRAQAWAQEKGAASIELTVWAFNQNALEFYAALGYKTIHHKMRKDLT